MFSMFERKFHYDTKSSSLNYILPNVKGSVGKGSCYNATKHQNKIPRELQEAPDMVTLKKELKQHL